MSWVRTRASSIKDSDTPQVSDQADPRCAAELLWITTGGIPESPGLATIAEAAMPHLTEVRTNGSQRSL